MTVREKRCEDCACLISKNGKMCCDELWGKPCDEVDECPEGIELEEVQELQEKASKIKIDHGASADKPKDKKKEKIVKVSNEKTKIFEDLVDFLQKDYDICIEKENKLLIIRENGKIFKLDLIETRQKKG